jgi:membrane complex biogenesis protein, BtpA family
MTVFRVPKPIIGMLHVPALPGSPANSNGIREIRKWVLADAEALAEGGVDGFILENFGDAPFYPGRVPPHTVAFLSVIGHDLKARFPLPLGINVLRNDALSALAVATAVEAEFVRVNVYTGARLSDQGILQGEAHEILRYRKLLESDVAVFADVAVKHSTAIGQRDLADEVEDTVRRGRADAIIISGSATGKRASLEDLQIARKAACGTPVFIGSGVDTSSAAELLAYADGAIVGTALKKDGYTLNPVDRGRVKALVEAVRTTRIRESRR